MTVRGGSHGPRQTSAAYPLHLPFSFEKKIKLIKNIQLWERGVERGGTSLKEQTSVAFRQYLFHAERKGNDQPVLQLGSKLHSRSLSSSPPSHGNVSKDSLVLVGGHHER